MNIALLFLGALVVAGFLKMLWIRAKSSPKMKIFGLGVRKRDGVFITFHVLKSRGLLQSQGCLVCDVTVPRCTCEHSPPIICRWRGSSFRSPRTREAHQELANYPVGAWLDDISGSAQGLLAVTRCCRYTVQQVLCCNGKREMPSESRLLAPFPLLSC